MKRLRFIFISILVCMSSLACRDDFSFSPYTVISVENAGQKAVADWFAWLFAKPGGFVPKVEIGAPVADVHLLEDPSMEEASYRIRSCRRRICIEASSPTGFFYALQAIRHLLPSEINSCRHADHVEWTVPAFTASTVPSTDCAGIVLDLYTMKLPTENVIHLIESMPQMKVYDLFLINDGNYTRSELEEMYCYADIHDVEIYSNFR